MSLIWYLDVPGSHARISTIKTTSEVLHKRCKDRVWLKPLIILQVKYDFNFIKFPVKDRELEKSKKFLVFPWENYDVSIQDMFWGRVAIVLKE